MTQGKRSNSSNACDSFQPEIDTFTFQHYSTVLGPPSGDILTVPDFPVDYRLFESVPVGGRLSLFVDNWRLVSQNAYLLSVLSDGYKIEFKELPPLQVNPDPFYLPLPDDQQSILDEEMQKFWDKDVIEPVDDLSTPGFYSTLFLRPKTDGGYRVIINLKPLNRYIVYRRFRMETSSSVRQGLSQGDYCFTVDCKDAYCHVKIHEASRKYLRFF